jgi:hypothetical protein
MIAVKLENFNMNRTHFFKVFIAAIFVSQTIPLTGCSALVTRKDFSGLRANLAEVQARRIQAEQREEAYKKQRSQNYQEAFNKLTKAQQQSLLQQREITTELKDKQTGAVVEGVGNVAGNIIRGDRHYCVD